jgi:hypothetical protein
MEMKDIYATDRLSLSRLFPEPFLSLTRFISSSVGSGAVEDL